MAKPKLKNAPISELIFGITFKNEVFAANSILEFFSQFKERYPSVKLVAPVGDYTINNNSIVLTIGANAGAGRYQYWNTESNELIQFQGNKLFFNWIRLDDEPINYPGFTSNYKKFKEFFIQVFELIDKVNDDDIQYYELTYHDRIEWGKHMESLYDINKVLNMHCNLVDDSDNKCLGFSKTDLFEISDLHSYMYRTIQTGNSTGNQKEIIKITSNLFGKKDGALLDDWFDIAHELHYKNFLNIFNKNIIDEWT